MQAQQRNTFRLHARFSVLAVFLLVALVAGVLVGGRLLHDRNAASSGTPVGHSTPSSYQDQFALLERRPLKLPTVKSSDPCPDTGNVNHVGFQFGAGPVYADGGPGSTSNWGDFYDVVWFTDPRLGGPVLIRGRDLVTNRDVIFTGAGAAGPTVATDPSQASPALRSELLLDASHPTLRENGYGVFHVRQGVPKGWSLCVGFQMDGAAFTETVTTAG
jgi:hypothetical protein